MSGHLSPDDMAAKYGVSRAFVMKRVQTRAWPFLRVGKFVRFTEEHVAQIDAMHEVQVSQETSAARSWGRKTRGGAA